MFACAMYPEDDPDFVAEVEAEARYQVRGCAATRAWRCGAATTRTSGSTNALLGPPEPAAVRRALLRRDPAARRRRARRPHARTGPAALRRQRPQQPRRGQRPQLGGLARQLSRAASASEPRRESTPETVTFLRYAEDLGRFISEFGMHAGARAARRCGASIPADQRYHHSPALDWHNKDNPKDKGDTCCWPITGLPRDLDEYIDFQPDRPGRGAEVRHRALPPPQAALLGHAGLAARRLLAGAELERAGLLRLRQGRLLLPEARLRAGAGLVQGAEDGGVELWITNDTRARRRGRGTRAAGHLRRRDGGRGGDRRARRRAARAAACAAGARDAQGGPDRYLRVEAPAGAFAPNRWFFAAIKDLARSRPRSSTTR